MNSPPTNPSSSPEDGYHILTLKAQKGRLYYYKGNFYYPLELNSSAHIEIRIGIRQFSKQHAEMIAKDRKDPNYLNKLELFDNSFPKK